MAFQFSEKFNLKLGKNGVFDLTMKKLFIITLLAGFAVAAQAGGECCSKADADKSGCPMQQAKSAPCCGGATQSTKAGTCPAMKKSTETTAKQRLQSPKEMSLAKKS
jgi:hypothetical protein